MFPTTFLWKNVHKHIPHIERGMADGIMWHMRYYVGNGIIQDCQDPKGLKDFSRTLKR